MPLTEVYLPNQDEIKKQTPYSLYSRPTIQYSLTCGLPISDAVQAQKALNEAIEEKTIHKFGVIIAPIVSIVILLVGFCAIWYASDEYDFLKRFLIISIVCQLIPSLVILIFSIINKLIVGKKFKTTQKWHSFENCVDEYMKVSESSYSDEQKLSGLYTRQTIFATLGFVIAAFSTAITMYAYCKTKK